MPLNLAYRNSVKNTSPFSRNFEAEYIQRLIIMKWNLLNQPLGIGDMSGGYAPRKKHAIPLAVPLVMAAGSALSSIWGGSKSAKAAREAQAKLDAEKAELNAERIKAKYQTWLDTLSGQNTLRTLRDVGLDYLQRVKGAAAVGGATEASVAAQKELNNDREAKVIAEGSAAFEDKKDAIDANYRQQISNLTQQQIGAKKQEGDAIAGAASGVSNSLAQGAIATFGGTKLGQQIMGAGSPGGGASTPEPAPAPSVPTKLQSMGKVELPTIGNKMFEHIGQLRSSDPYIDWLKKTTAGLKLPG